MEEIYIFEKQSHKKRGPFNRDQIESLIEAGRIDQTTLYYESIFDTWIPIKYNKDLYQILFPVVDQLKLKLKPNSTPMPTVATHTDTSHTSIKRPEVDILDTPLPHKLSLWLGIIMVISSIGLLYPVKDLFSKFMSLNTWAQPLFTLGILDALISGLLLLGIVGAFHLLRIRIAFGAGILTYLYWAWAQPIPLTLNLISSCSIFAATLCSSQRKCTFFIALSIFSTTAFSSYINYS